MPDLRTSFISQKPLTPSTSTPGRHSVDPLTFIAWAVFLFSVLATFGLYGYKTILGNRIASKETDIKKVIELIDPALVESLQAMDARLDLAQKLLNDHAILSSLFSFLETNTLRPLRFLDFKYDEDTPGVITMSMKGEARDYATIALQSDALEKESNIQNLVFSNFTLTDRGTISFDLDASVNKSFLLYRQQKTPDVAEEIAPPKDGAVPE